MKGKCDSASLLGMIRCMSKTTSRKPLKACELCCHSVCGYLMGFEACHNLAVGSCTWHHGTLMERQVFSMCDTPKRIYSTVYR